MHIWQAPVAVVQLHVLFDEKKWEQKWSYVGSYVEINNIYTAFLVKERDAINLRLKFINGVLYYVMIIYTNEEASSIYYNGIKICYHISFLCTSH